VIGLLIVGGLHLHYGGWFDPAAGPEDPQLQALAIHLKEAGATFYGAYWCPRCQEQKSTFLSSAKRLRKYSLPWMSTGTFILKGCSLLQYMTKEKVRFS